MLPCKTLLALCFALTASMAQATTYTLFDDDFSADSAGVVGFSTVTDLTNWKVTKGNVDILGAGFSCSGCIDLDGSSSPAPAVLETKTVLNFLANTTYTFRLFFSEGTQTEFVTLQVVGTVSFSATAAPMVFETIATTGGPVSSTFKIIMSEQPNDYGPYLDRVQITYDLPDVPVPASAPLLLAGLAGLAALRRKARAGI